MSTIMEILNDIPKVLDQGKFYCYDTRKGEIAIGEIVGNSILSSVCLLRIRGRHYKLYQGFSEERRIIDIAGSNWRGFLDYGRFEGDYKEFLDEKSKRPPRKQKFLVHKTFFYCSRSRAYSENIPNYFRIFEKEEDALECSKRGLNRLKNSAKINLAKLEKLESILKAKADLYWRAKKSEKRVSEFRLKPSDLTPGENLFKVRFKETGCYNLFVPFFEIVPSSEAKVTEVFLYQRMAVLSDGSLLLHEECIGGFPILCRCEEREEIENTVNFENFHRLLGVAGKVHKQLEDTIGYCEKYVPFKNRDEQRGFSREQIKEIYTVAEDLLKNLEV